jgi:outer membrane receptor for ferrienterochelin and colicins
LPSAADQEGVLDHSSHIKAIAPLLVSCPIFLAVPAHAQDAAVALQPRYENGRQLYEAAQFARFAPQTARDMVAQIPGFQINQVSSDRGLGEATQNVLINGQRISGKGDNAETVLRRTPAKAVLRLEIADGATFSISGLSGQVLNVVTTPDRFSGNFSWKPEFRSQLEPRWYNAELNISGKIGKGDYTVGINNNDSFRNGFRAIEISRDAQSNPLFERKQTAIFYGDRPHIDASYSRKSDAGSIFNIKSAYEQFRFRRRVETDRIDIGGTPSTELSTGREREWNVESSVDYEFAALGGRLKLVGYNRFEHSPNISLFRRDFTNGASAIGSRFAGVFDEGETVLRGEYKWKSGKTDWQFSLEGAQNFLDAESEYFDLDNSGVFQPINVPGASARVEEKRAQAIISYARPLTDTLKLQATLGGEYSKLTQDGTNGLARTFWRPKGSVQLAWKASPRLDISLRLQRKVGQLNFGDFLASVDLQDDNDNAGNPELVPPQSWLLDSEMNRSLGKSGSIKLNLEAEGISDTVDQIAISPLLEGVGNLPGAAKRVSGKLTVSLLLDTLGLKGVKLDATGYAQASRLRDALGQRRPISGSDRAYYGIELRHDIPGSHWAWGGSIEDGINEPFYRLDYRFKRFNIRPFALLFLEHKNILGLKVRGQLFNVAGNRDNSREIFYQNRRNGPIGSIRATEQTYGLFYRLSISGTF